MQIPRKNDEQKSGGVCECWKQFLNKFVNKCKWMFVDFPPKKKKTFQRKKLRYLNGCIARWLLRLKNDGDSALAWTPSHNYGTHFVLRPMRKTVFWANFSLLLMRSWICAAPSSGPCCQSIVFRLLSSHLRPLLQKCVRIVKSSCRNFISTMWPGQLFPTNMQTKRRAPKPNETNIYTTTAHEKKPTTREEFPLKRRTATLFHHPSKFVLGANGDLFPFARFSFFFFVGRALFFFSLSAVSLTSFVIAVIFIF